MAKQEYPYPDDEFDVLGADRTPQGVHRTPRPFWRYVLPFVVVLVLAPTLAYFGVGYLSGLGSGPATATTTAPAAADADETEPPADEPTEPADEVTPEPTETPTPTPTEEAPVVLRDTRIFVLNGSGSSGWGAGAADRLTADGFTSVVADDYSSRQPRASTVFYNNPELADTAIQVATVLGIGPLVEMASATDSVAVVLRSDYVP